MLWTHKPRFSHGPAEQAADEKSEVMVWGAGPQSARSIPLSRLLNLSKFHP